jgi:hypothetical protein
MPVRVPATFHQMGPGFPDYMPAAA